MEVRKWLTCGIAGSVDRRAVLEAQDGGNGSGGHEDENGEQCQSWEARIFSGRSHVDESQVSDVRYLLDEKVEGAGRRNCGDSPFMVLGRGMQDSSRDISKGIPLNQQQDVNGMRQSQPCHR